jgi:hypothetical protein
MVWTREETKLYEISYRERNKEHIALQKAIWYESNKEDIALKRKTKYESKKEELNARRKNIALLKKVSLVTLHGGRCSACHYSRNLSALCFHHIDPTTKDRELKDMTVEEAEKCVLLCFNCHREYHNGGITY